MDIAVARPVLRTRIRLTDSQKIHPAEIAQRLEYKSFAEVDVVAKPRLFSVY